VPFLTFLSWSGLVERPKDEEGGLVKNQGEPDFEKIRGVSRKKTPIPDSLKRFLKTRALMNVKSGVKDQGKP